MGKLDNHINKKKKKGKKNKTKKKMNRLTKIISILVLLILTFIVIAVSGVFSVKKIDIKTDGEKVSIQEIKSLSTLSENMNMFEFSSKAVEENIKKNPYIGTVEVKRHLDGTVSINVKERIAKYKINYAGGYILIDSGGYVLEITSEEKDLPIILGTSTDFSNLTVGSTENRVNILNE